MRGVGFHTHFLALLHALPEILGSEQTQAAVAEGAVVSTAPLSEAEEAHYPNEEELDLSLVALPSALFVVLLVLSR